jgi:hypothetical protein
MRTINPTKGIIKLHIAPGCEEQVDRILQDLKKEILIQRLAMDPSESSKNSVSNLMALFK